MIDPLFGDAPVYVGAQHDLEQIIHTHLFVICPNNGGSTFLKNVLATSKHTWNLEREGQHTFGFAGPRTRTSATALIWASTPTWISHFSDSTAYDWETIRRAWYFQAFSRNPSAGVFVTKAPPFLLIVGLLARAFHNARFLFMVRNPYAVAEGIYRRKQRHRTFKDEELLRLAARHIMTCLEVQRHNITAFAGQGTWFTYETMSDTPQRVEQQIQDLVPALNDVRLSQRIAVKQDYDEPLRNMNAQQIDRLRRCDLDVLNDVFAPREELLRFFGYSLIV